MGTRIKREGQIVEKQPSLSQLATEQGQNTPLTPDGAAGIGATPKQQDMAGTPAQTQAQIKNVTRQRAPQTLTQAERYEKAAPATEAMQQAKDVASTLQQLGPVQTRIQSLIQDRLQAAQATTAELGINQQAIDNIQDPAQREAAQAALSTYLSSPTEANLQAVYDTMGSSALEDIQTYFTGTEEAMQAALQPAIAGDANLGTIDLTPLGTSLEELSSILNVPAAQLEVMSLDELNQEIDKIQAEELNRMEQLYATLSSPSATPQMRQAAMDELRQLGAAGIPGAEQEVVRLQDQIDEAQTINVAGREMRLEDALGDEGISALIAQASYDDNVLAAMKKDPRYAQMAEWVGENKLALQDLATEYEGEAQDFLGVQEEYRATKESLGEGGEDLLSLILDQELEGSVLSSEMEGIKATLEASDLYGVAVDNEIFREDLKGQPEVAKEMLDEDLTEEEILTSIDIKEAAEEDELFAKFLGADGYVTSKAELADGEDTAKDIYDRYMKIDPDIASRASDIEGLTLANLEDINASDDPEGIIQDIAEQQAWKKQWKVNGQSNERAMDYVFGSTGWSAMDLNYALKNAPQDVVDTILSIFDEDGDKKVSQEEIDNADLTTKIPEVFGANDDLSKMIARDGTYDPETAVSRLKSKLSIEPDTYEKEVREKIKEHLQTRRTDLEKKLSQLSTPIQSLEGELALSAPTYQRGTAEYEQKQAELKEAWDRMKNVFSFLGEDFPQISGSVIGMANPENEDRIQKAKAAMRKQLEWPNNPSAQDRDVILGHIQRMDTILKEMSDYKKHKQNEKALYDLENKRTSVNSLIRENDSLDSNVLEMDEQQLYDQINLLGLEI